MSKQSDKVASHRELFGRVSVHTDKPDSRGRRRIWQNFGSCVSRTDPSGARETDLNYLVSRYSASELSMMLAARSQRQAILDHDFSRELTLSDAKSVFADLNKRFKDLPDNVRGHFGNVRNFARYIMHPQVREGLAKLRADAEVKAKSAEAKSKATAAAKLKAEVSAELKADEGQPVPAPKPGKKPVK